MLDGSEYEHLKSLYHQTRNIVQDGTLFEKELACIELFESIGRLLNRYEAEAEAMAQWYEAQEVKMTKERMRVQEYQG